jgi:hypothetical protein
MESRAQRVKTSIEDAEIRLKVPLPSCMEQLKQYEEICFHLAQAPGLCTALRKTYGDCSRDAEFPLSKFLAETTDERYITWVGEQLFSQPASASFKAHLLSLCENCKTNIMGIFFASLMPQYCRWFRETNVYEDDDEIILSFLIAIRSLRIPGWYLWLILMRMRKYYRFHQTFSAESPKDLRLLWTGEEEKFASDRRGEVEELAKMEAEYREELRITGAPWSELVKRKRQSKL